ncbi:hypothetical protein QE152_g19823 [Popillia japonica]|uniref:Uncharacterized protein n=1 Tax=Popillia japonica TaxID=7064 RepID=A0AAW1KR95_POPJA
MRSCSCSIKGPTAQTLGARDSRNHRAVNTNIKYVVEPHDDFFIKYVVEPHDDFFVAKYNNLGITVPLTRISSTSLSLTTISLLPNTITWDLEGLMLSEMGEEID